MEQKAVSVNERSLTSTDWSVYNNGTKRTRYSSVPTSDITAEMVTAGGFVLAQKDSAGIETSATRSYTASGMQLTRTDGRGNTTTTVTDVAGRVLTVTDAAGNATGPSYQLATITDAMGNTTCYRYDIRGCNPSNKLAKKCIRFMVYPYLFYVCECKNEPKTLAQVS